MDIILQLITAFLGSLGFALLFHIRGSLIFPASLGGMLEWGIYLITSHYLGGIFLPCLIASAFSAFYAELLARYFKAPAIVFFIPAVVPLIPGSTLYYTMSYAVQGRWIISADYRMRTLKFTLGIGAGISLVWSFNYMLRKIIERRRPEK